MAPSISDDAELILFPNDLTRETRFLEAIEFCMVTQIKERNIHVRLWFTEPKFSSSSVLGRLTMRFLAGWDDLDYTVWAIASRRDGGVALMAEPVVPLDSISTRAVKSWGAKEPIQFCLPLVDRIILPVPCHPDPPPLKIEQWFIVD